VPPTVVRWVPPPAKIVDTRICFRSRHTAKRPETSFRLPLIDPLLERSGLTLGEELLPCRPATLRRIVVKSQVP
jgi:hypothetical protein